MATQKLTFKIGADNRQAIQGMNRFKNKVKGISGSVAGMLCMALGGAAVIGVGKKLIEMGDKIGKLGKRYGITTDAIQKFKYMAEISGTNLESVSKGIKILVTNTGEANAGLATYQRYFQQLGVDYQKLAKMAPEDQFDVVAKALGKLDNKQKKVYLSSKLLGRAGNELIPMFNDYNQLAREAADNIVFSAKDVAAAEAYNDSMNRIGKSLSRAIVDSGFLPWLADVADKLDKSVGLPKQIEQAQAGGTTGRGVSKMYQGVKFGMEMIKAISPVGMGMDALFGGMDKGLMLETGNTATEADAAAMGKTLVEIRDALQPKGRE